MKTHSPKPTDRIKFYYTNKIWNKECLEVEWRHFKEVAIDLLELTHVDNISEIYYTVKDITRKLDYYSEELLWKHIQMMN